ncbi:MAG: hypothetical protein ABGZ53_28190 [Fuerstiella sp.]
MKNFFALGMILTVASAVTAGEAVKSGPQTGDKLGAFYVTKCAGAETDGVAEGKNLCYRCRNGAKPQVVIFTRSTDKRVIELVQLIDKAIAKHKDSKLTAFVNVLGEDKEDLSDAARKLAKASKATNVPFVVPNEFENGPDDYGINPKAAVTIILASDLGVKANFSVSDVNDLKIAAVIADLKKIL